MKGLFALLAFIPASVFLNAQYKDSIPDLSKGNYTITNLQEDTISFKDRASQVLRMLKNGAVIVRLKTNQKSVDAYRKAGKEYIAERIEEDRKKQNQQMYRAFTNNFHFCKVLFIYANETTKFLEGDRPIFLNEALQHDSTIIFTDTNFVFCEYGSVESYSKFNDYESPSVTIRETASGRVNGRTILDTIPTQTSTSPATTNGLFFSDKDLKQFFRPFPFATGVYLNNYDASVRGLNREIERAFMRLVVKQDFKEKIKEEKKKRKEFMKQ